MTLQGWLAILFIASVLGAVGGLTLHDITHPEKFKETHDE